MKKTIVSLFCVLALCLGLLPTAALAAGESDLVSGQLITESGCYENQMEGTKVTVQTCQLSLLRRQYRTLTLNNVQSRAGAFDGTTSSAGICAKTTESTSLSNDQLNRNKHRFRQQWNLCWRW